MNNWETCPVCKGTGNRADAYIGSSLQVCTVCNGMKIINSFSGMPPNAPKQNYKQGKTPQQIKDYQDEIEEAIFDNLSSQTQSDVWLYGYTEIQLAIRKALAENGGEGWDGK